MTHLIWFWYNEAHFFGNFLSEITGLNMSETLKTGLFWPYLTTAVFLKLFCFYSYFSYILSWNLLDGFDQTQQTHANCANGYDSLNHTTFLQKTLAWLFLWNVVEKTSQLFVLMNYCHIPPLSQEFNILKKKNDVDDTYLL